MASRRRPPSPLRVRLSPPDPRLHRKLERYFQSRQSGGGECTVRPVDGGEPGVYLVRFREPADKESVLKKENHCLTIDGETVSVYLEPTGNPTQENARPRKSSLTQLVDEPRSDEKHPDEEYPPDTVISCVQKIFLDVTANLNCDLFSKEQRSHIPILFPNVKRMEGINGIEKVCGDFRDIQNIYHYLSSQVLDHEPKHGSSTFLKERQLLSLPNRSSSVTSLEERQLRHPSESSSSITPLKPETRSETKSSRFEIPLLFFEYFKYIFPNKIDSIEKKFGVKIKTQENVPNYIYLEFIASQSDDIDSALESFVGEFQKITACLGEERITSPDNKESHKIKKKLALQFEKLLIKENGRELILIGTQDDITAAKHFLASLTPDSLTKVSLKILPPGYMVNGIEVDTSQYKLLIDELCQAISEIEKKYNTRSHVLEKSQRTVIIFEPKDKELNLSVHAYVNFIDAYQDIASQLTREILSLKSFSKKKKHLQSKQFADDFRKNHPHVHFVPNDETVTLIGLPDLLTKAKQYVLQREGVSLLTEKKQSGDHETTMDIDIYLETAPTTFQHSAGAGHMGQDDNKNLCSICMDTISDKKVLPKCKHEFCTDCINKAFSFKPVCPMCQTSYGVQKGNQPEGTMSVNFMKTPLPGYDHCGTIVIHYNMKEGIQTEEHPNPGKRYCGAQRKAYLPDNEEGKEVLKLLRRAFEQKLIFTVGTSRTSGMSDVITWNDIHHKTALSGGPEQYGYPDPDYLKRVKQELKDKGIE
ncbi:E3 ubiquitin-protein ligase DTX3L [Sorex fumeus]|uniref:E3 ubiquitin-protein ligase DTX3L n=1 Tax=Sorex fumeus TaxID=62283 RepID=UPI0024AE23CD|nr:E3 ubiquitin-protein ligase DTX3L [Sorex fumeus]